jgi:hypothetical protein
MNQITEGNERSTEDRNDGVLIPSHGVYSNDYKH